MSLEEGLPLQVPISLLNMSQTENHTIQPPGAYITEMENITNKLVKDPLITLTVPAIMFASGVLGNMLAIFVLLRSSREHKQTVFYRLVGALACTDLFGTCATSPVTLAVYANNIKWVGGEALCNYESFMLIFAGYATIFIVGAMAVDRFIAICYPFFYDAHITYTRAKFGILGLWGFAIIMGCLPIMGLGESKLQFPGTWCFFTFTSAKLKNQIFAYGYASIALFVIGLTAVTNVFVTSVLLKMRRKAARTLNLCNTKRHDSELQMMVLLLGIIIIFSTCWCPFMIRIIINQTSQRQVDVKADLHALRLASFNQILDPWIYILFRKEMFIKAIRFFKESVFKRCQCICENTQDRSSTHRVIANSKALAGIHTNTDLELHEHSNALIEHEHTNIISNERTSETDKYQNRMSSRSNSCRKSRSKSPGDESVSLRNSGIKRQHLELKHSSCLFCFANHPKNLALSSITSKSMDDVHLECGCQKHDTTINTNNCATINKRDDTPINAGGETLIDADGDKAMDTLCEYDRNNKRNSFHLSLTDLTLQMRVH